MPVYAFTNRVFSHSFNLAAISFIARFFVEASLHQTKLITPLTPKQKGRDQFVFCHARTQTKTGKCKICALASNLLINQPIFAALIAEVAQLVRAQDS